MQISLRSVCNEINALQHDLTCGDASPYSGGTLEFRELTGVCALGNMRYS